MGGAADRPLPILGWIAVGLWLAGFAAADVLLLYGHFWAGGGLLFVLLVILGVTLRGGWEGVL